MKVGSSGELIYWTYYMIEWEKMKQSPSLQRCVNCRAKMSSTEIVRDKKGREYEGLVCHNCKTVLWLRRA